MPIMAVALLFATACNDNDTEWVTPPTISPTSAVVTAPDDGGSVSLTYTVSNPADDATTTAVSSESWISDVSVPSEGTVSFTVDANSSLEPRTGRITITYSYTLIGTKGTASCDVTIAQSCGGDPALSVQSAVVVAGAEGGSYSFGYTIVNPEAEGKVEASTEEEWITGLTDSNGTVSFTVEENKVIELRSGVITLTYTYSKGSVSEMVRIVQDHLNANVKAEITGTYIAFGYDYQGDMNWTMTIHRDTGDPTKYWVDGLTPNDAGRYETSGTSHCAHGSLSDDGTTFVIPSQISSGWIEGDFYIGWAPCVKYDGNWYYDGDFPDITFTYDPDTDTWISDYGVFLGAFSTASLSSESFSGYYDVVAPPITISKTAEIKSLSSDKKSITGTEPLTGMMAK